MKNIIVPVDFSKHSEYALKAGAQLAKKHNSKLWVMHMLELSESIVSMSDSERQNEMLFMLALSNKKMEAFLDKDYLNDIDVNPVIKHHKVLKEIENLGQDEPIDLIVMGSKGHSDHDGIFTGSNTQKVVRFSNTPVLVIKNEVENIELKKVTLATDMSKESIDSFNKATQLFKSLDSDVSLVHVNRPGHHFRNTDEIMEVANSFFSKTNDNWKQKINYASDYSIEDGIFSQAKRENADAIAVLTHGRKGLKHFFGGSISEDISNHSQLPVFTFKI